MRKVDVINHLLSSPGMMELPKVFGTRKGFLLNQFSPEFLVGQRSWQQPEFDMVFFRRSFMDFHPKDFH